MSISIASRSISSSVRGSSRPLAGDLHQQADAGQGRSQLVRDRRQKLALLAELAFETPRHLVERPGQHRQLVETRALERRQRRPRPEVPLPDRLRDARELVERLREPAGDAPRARPEQQRGNAEQHHRAPGMRGQPGPSGVPGDERRQDAEKDGGAEPEEQPMLQVRAVVEAHLPAHALRPPRPAANRLADHAIPRVAVAEAPPVGVAHLLDDAFAHLGIEVPPEAPSPRPAAVVRSGRPAGKPRSAAHATPPAPGGRSGLSPGGDHGRGQHVAHAANGLDETRGFGIVAELAPQVRDVDVHRPVAHRDVVAAGLLEQALARHHPPRPARQGEENVELEAGQIGGGGAHPNPASPHVYRHLPDDDLIAQRTPAARAAAPPATGPEAPAAKTVWRHNRRRRAPVPPPDPLRRRGR